MKRGVIEALYFFTGSAALCLFITLQRLSTGSPLTLNTYWIPFIFGGIAGLILEKWLFHQKKMVNDLKRVHTQLEKKFEVQTTELIGSIKELEESIERLESIKDKAAEAKPTAREKPLILIIDDDDQIRKMLKELLENAGYETMEASDGKEGLKLQYERPADLIIVDILMPEKDGKDTIIELKKDFPEVKIIAISGGGWIGPEMDLDISARLGADKAFAKPISKKELLRAIKKLC